MKKIIFSMLALAALSSCVKEQTIETQQPNAIKFANTFVENATRTNNPVTDTDNIEEIYVWGIVANETGIVFDDEKVWKSGSQWTYGETQYWTPGNDYWFSAIAGDRSNDQIVIKTAADGGMSTEGLGTVTFTNASGVNDVLYAEYKTTTSNSLNEVPDPVKFQFQHLLSKVQFTFKNGFQNNNNTVVVTGIEMDVPAVGVIDLTQDELAWTGLQDELTLDMGTMNNEEHVTIGKSAVSDNVRFTIPAPATQTYAIRFHVALYMGDVLAYETDMTTAVTGVALEMGKAYNFTATIDQNSLDLHKIEFNVGVTEWEDAIDTPAYVGNTAYVHDATEFAAALNDPEVNAVVLNEDIELTTTLTKSGESEAVITKSFVLDGNGKTLTYSGSARAIDIRSEVENATAKNVTIKDITLNFTSSYVERGINYNANGTLVLDGVKFTGTAPSYAVNFPGKADNADVTINNCEVTGLIALNVWGENMTINVTNSVLTSVDKSTVEGYAAVKLNNDGSNIADGTLIYLQGSKVVATDENGEPSSAIYNASETGEIVVAEDCEIVGTNKVQVAAVYYDNTDNFYGAVSLADAIKLAVETEAAGIRLTRSIEVNEGVKVANGQTIVLDLNGKTISGTDSNTSGNFYLIDNRGNLTIKDNSAAKTGSITLKANTDRDWNASSVVVANNPGGKLILDGGIIEHLGGSDMAYGIDNLTNGKGTYAETVINGGNVKSPYRAVRQFLNGVEAQNILTVNGGVIEGANKSIWMQDPSAKANTGKLTVAPEAQLKGDVYLFVTAGSTEWPVEVSIAEAAFVEGTVLTGNVPAGMLVMNKDGNWVVVDAEEEGITVVYTADDLNKLSAKNAYVVLGADIDFQGAAMTKPIELWGDSTFDGMGHKISNVKTAVQGGYATSLFRGDANPGNKVVKNLVIENLTTPADYSFASAIWSDLQGANIEIDNVTINNSTIEANGTIGGFVGFVSASTTSVVVKNSSINNSNLNGGEADHKRGAVVGRAYGCTVTCDDVVVDNVKINGAAATTSTLVGDKGYTGTVTVK